MQTVENVPTRITYFNLPKSTIITEINYWDCFPYDLSCEEMVQRVQDLTQDRRAYTGLLCERYNKSATPLFRQKNGEMGVRGSLVWVVLGVVGLSLVWNEL